jgi:RHS repeat-associated protein
VLTQSTPPTPTGLAAGPGDGNAYVTWNTPTAVVTQYVVTPYLNGTPLTPIVAPASSPNLTVPNLGVDNSYTFTITAQNCLGSSAESAKTGPVIPRNTEGTSPDAKVESSRITDRSSMHVNVFNGNLTIVNRDLALAGTGSDFTVDRTYNNLGSAFQLGLGRNWHLGELFSNQTTLPDGSVVILMSNGVKVGFGKNSDGSFASPSGVDAVLTTAAPNYILTEKASGEKWTFPQGSSGRLLTHADRNGNTITFTPGDGSPGSVTQVLDTKAQTTTFTYGTSGRISQLRDPSGQMANYGYDNATGQLTSFTDQKGVATGVGGTTQYSYDVFSNLKQITTPTGRVITFDYDTSKRLVGIHHPNQANDPTTRFAYTTNLDGTHTTTEEDANTKVTTFVFDPIGRLLNVVDALSNAESLTYTANSNVSTYSTGSGAASGKFGYDTSNNRTLAYVQPGAHSTAAFNDGLHPFQPSAVSDPQDNTSSLTYDANGNLTKLTDPLPANNQTLTPRNANGTIASVTDAGGHQTTYGYDPKGNLNLVTPPAPLPATSATYDSLNRFATSTDGSSVQTAYTYDALDRVTQVTIAGVVKETRVYDDDGNLTSVTNQGGTATLTYDAMSRLIERRTLHGSLLTDVTYTYDGVGNTLTVTDLGGTTTYHYDAVNRPDQVTDASGKTTLFGYDANGNRTSENNQLGLITTSTYDSANRLINRHTTINGVNPADRTNSYTPGGPTHGSARAITQRGASSLFATNSNNASAVTLAAPNGLSNGDVEIAQVVSTGNTTVSSVPAGWTFDRIDGTGGQTNDILTRIYHHVVTNSATEPAVYTWAMSAPTLPHFAGGLTAWTGVDNTSPIETSAAIALVSYPNTVIGNAPASYWPLDDTVGTNANDLMAHHAGTVNGGAGVTRAQSGPIPGRYAMGFNGSTGYVSVPVGSDIQPTTALSLEGWFKVGGGTGTRSIVSDSATTGTSYALSVDSTGKLVGQACATVGTCTGATSTATVTDSAWHYAVFTKNSTNIVLYLDGVQVATAAMTQPIAYSASPGIAIARDGKNSTNFFNGSLEDVAIYGTALTAANVAAHFAAGPTVSTTWTAPSLSYLNGELSLLAYAGRPLGAGSAITPSAAYTNAYDTQSDWLTAGMATRTLGAVAGTTNTQAATGPYAWWAAQHILLRPVYDSAVAQSTPTGAKTYDALNRLTASGDGYTYTYDPVSNRQAASSSTETLLDSANADNQLTTRNKPVALRSVATNTGTLTSTNLSVNVPAGTKAGDVMIAQIATSPTGGLVNGGPITAPTGWTVISDTTNTVHTVNYWHVATASEPTSYTWTYPIPNYGMGGIAAYTGVDNTSPIDQTATANGSSTTPAAPSVTTTGVDDQLLALVSSSLTSSYTAPTGMTQQWHVGTGVVATGSLNMFDQVTANPAATGTRTATAGTNSPWIATAVALRAATKYTYDANGNLTGNTDGPTIQYDGATNRTSAFNSYNGAPNTALTYRSLGQDEVESIIPATRQSAACTHVYGCSGLSTQIAGSALFVDSNLGITTENLGGSFTYYVRDPSGNLVSERTPTGTYYYVLDNDGSVRQIVDTAGNTVATYAYDPYGRTTTMTGGTIAINNPWRYRSGYQDGTGLYHFGARFYDPVLGRWTQEDPVFSPFSPTQWNRYAYVGGDPINLADASGLGPCKDRDLRAVTEFVGYDKLIGLLGRAITADGDSYGRPYRDNLGKLINATLGIDADTAGTFAVEKAGGKAAGKVVGDISLGFSVGATVFDLYCEATGQAPAAPQQIAPGSFGSYVETVS